MVAQDAVEFGAESFDRGAALAIEMVCAEFDGDAVEVFECVT